MCGIAGGFWSNSQEVPSLCEIDSILLSQSLTRRGPDHSGVHCQPGAILGMNRLSIIDVKGGNQPILNEDGTISVVQNGEIYNYKNLRNELVKLGHQFKSQSDTEVLVHGYEQWGIKGLLNKIQGMFAFAIYDSRKKEMFIARDRMGIKPLFYFKNSRLFLFASDLLALISHPQTPRKLNKSMLWRFLSIGYPAGPETFLEGIKQLDSGTYLTIYQDGKVEQTRYWELSYPSEVEEKNDHRNVDEIILGLEERILSAVDRQKKCDVPFGAFLSGGLDSATVVWALSRSSKLPIETFSIGFEDKSFDESEHAAQLAKHFGSHHHELKIGAPTEEEFDNVLKFWDQPHFDFSAYPTYMVSKLAKSHVKVALTGDGGDEIFGGYPTYIAGKWVGNYQHLPHWLRKGVITPLINSMPLSNQYMSLEFKAKSFVNGANSNFKKSHYNWKILFSEIEKNDLFDGDKTRSSFENDPYLIFEKEFEKCSKASLINQLLFVDGKTFLIDNGLYKVDRMSMATGLEARVPLLDEDLVEYAVGIPSRYKIKGLSTKWILRKMMESHLPKTQLNLPKQGFTPPFSNWCRSSLRSYVEHQILDSKALPEFFDTKLVASLLREHREHKRDHSRKISAILSFLNWHARVLE